MVQFLRTWLVVVIVFFVLTLCWSIFSPIMNATLSPLVDDAIYNGQQHSGANGDQSSFYSSLYSGKMLILSFYNLFPWILSCVLITYGILNSLRRENDNYYT